MNPSLRGVLLGALTAVPMLALGAWLPHFLAVSFFAVLLGVTAGVYLGFAIDDGRRTLIVLETMALLFFVLLAMAGLNLGVRWIALGFFLHGLWDVAHHPRAVTTRVARWYPPACLAFDWILAAFILLRWR